MHVPCSNVIFLSLSNLYSIVLSIPYFLSSRYLTYMTYLVRHLILTIKVESKGAENWWADFRSNYSVCKVTYPQLYPTIFRLMIFFHFRMKLFTVLVTVLFLSNLVQSIPYLERYGRSSPHLARRHERSQLTKHESKNEVLKPGFGLGFGGTVLGKRTQYYENMWPFSVRKLKSDLLICITFLLFCISDSS